MISTERAHSPEATRGLGVGVMIFLFLMASTAGVVAIICLLLFPVVSTLAGKGIRAVKDRGYAEDAAALQTHLAAKPNTNSKDRAGNTLLAFAIRRFRFENGNPECIRLLRAGGAAPNMPGDACGWPPLMELGEFPAIVRDLVEAGANIETRTDGMTASTASIPKAGAASAPPSPKASANATTPPLQRPPGAPPSPAAAPTPPAFPPPHRHRDRDTTALTPTVPTAPPNPAA